MSLGRYGAVTAWIRRLSFCVALSAIIGGCQWQDPELSPSQAAFKKDITASLERIITGIREPLARHDAAVTLEKLILTIPENSRLCCNCPFMAAVLDRNGIGIASFPDGPSRGKDFSDYGSIRTVLQQGRIVQRRLYFQDGQTIFVICAPVSHTGKIIGALVLAFTQEDARKCWDLSPQEFEAVDLNR